MARELYFFVLKMPVGEGEPGLITLWLKRKGAWANRLILRIKLSWLDVWVSVVALLLVWLATDFICILGKTAGLTTAKMAKEDDAKGYRLSKPSRMVIQKGYQIIAI